MREKEIHIVLSSSDSFMPYCATAMASILCNLSKDYIPHFYILSYDVTAISKKKLSKLSKIRNCTIEFPKFDEKMLDMFDGIRIPPHVMKMTYARILIPHILPHVNRAIFVDSDMVVKADLSELYNLDIGDNVFAAAEDWNWKNLSKRLWGVQEYYFNAGLLLINVAKLRQINYLNVIKKHIEVNKSNYFICDQDVINDSFRWRIQRISISWNFYHSVYNRVYGSLYTPENQREFIKIQKNPNVIHYVGPNKPWYPTGNHEYKLAYLTYCRKTAFYKCLKIQKYTIGKENIKCISFRDFPIFVRTSENGKRRFTFIGIKFDGRAILNFLMRKEVTNTVYRLKLLGLTVIKKGNSFNKQYIKFLGVPLYWKRQASHKEVDNRETFPSEELNKQILELKNLVNRRFDEFLEYSYRRSFAPLHIYNHHHKVLRRFKNIHRDTAVVICGAGPSLNKYYPIQDCIHIGLNRVYENPRLKLDYIFAWDFNNLCKEDAKFYEKIQNYPAQKICGKFINDQAPQITDELAEQLDALVVYSSTMYGLGGKVYDPYIHYDIESYPLMDFGSVAFGAFHFALYTGTKKIYLVGLDNSLNGYFDKSHNQRFLQVNEIYNGWVKVKEFMRRFYPDVEIVSINPVGLKGLFKDVYL